MKSIYLFLGLFLMGCNAQGVSHSQLNCDKIIDKIVETICYNYKVNGPVYVQYDIDGNLVDKVNIKKRPRFYGEKTLPIKHRVKPADYIYTIASNDCGGNFNVDSKLSQEECSIKYDRGHLAPDADFDYDPKILRKIYTMANIIPQVSVVNEKTWLKVEKYERYIAKKLGKVQVTIGVEYNNPNNILVKRPISSIKSASKWSLNKIRKYHNFDKQLREKHIVVPSGFWKHYKAEGFEKCFYYENKFVDIKQDKLANHIIDCSKLPR